MIQLFKVEDSDSSVYVATDGGWSRAVQVWCEHILEAHPDASPESGDLEPERISVVASNVVMDLTEIIVDVQHTVTK